MLIESTNLERFFTEKINVLQNREDTKAYIVSTFLKYKASEDDLSQNILALEYAKAKFEHNFNKFQKLADWILFTKSLYPESLNNASEEYYLSLAQSAYYKCYLIINRSWVLFEELADKLPDIINHLNAEFYQDLSLKHDLKINSRLILA